MAAIRGSFKDCIPVLCVLDNSENQEENSRLFESFATYEGCLMDGNCQNLTDAILTAKKSRSPVFLRLQRDETEPPMLKKRVNAARERNHRTSQRKENNVIDLVMTQLKDNLSAEDLILISEMPCLKIKFPSGCICEFGRENGSIGWSVGATIGYSLSAAKGKRVITCIQDLSFQRMVGEISTMLKIPLNAIIILIHTSLCTSLVRWDYSAIIDAMDEGNIKSWTTKVSSKTQLGKAICIANRLRKDKLCFIEVCIDPIALEERTYEIFRLEFCEDSQENEHLRDDDAFCIICYDKIRNREFVVSYDVCCHRHVFHKVCLDELFLNGHQQCPWDSCVLDGPCKKWIFRSDDVLDDDDDCKVSPKPLLRGNINIEDQCSQCAGRYKEEDQKISLVSCSHTFCSECFTDISMCSVCGGPINLWHTTIVYEAGSEVVPQPLSLNMIYGLGANQTGQENADVQVNEEQTGQENTEVQVNEEQTGQENAEVQVNEEQAGQENAEVQVNEEQTELNVEGAAWDEEMEVAEADFRFEVSEWFWEGL